MRKLLLGFGLVALLSACSSPDESVVETAPENTADTSDQNSVNDIIPEAEETPVAIESEPEPEVEPELDILNDSSVVESKSSDVDFGTCIQQQAGMAEAILSSGNYNVIPIVDTNVLSMVKFCTNDNSVIHTCSAPDNKMIVTISTNKEGC